MNHRFGFSTSGNPTKHMPIDYWSLSGQLRSVASGDLRWPWNSCDVTPITSTIPIQVNRTTPSCVYSRFRWNLPEGCSLCDVMTSWPDLTWPIFFHQKLRKGLPISYRKSQHDSPNGLSSSSEKLMAGCITLRHWRGLSLYINLFVSQRATCSFFPRSSSSIRGETARGVVPTPLVPWKDAKWAVPARGKYYYQETQRK